MKIKRIPIRDPDNVNWFVVSYLFIITSIGSLASYCYRILNGDQFHIETLIVQIFIFTFADELVILAASYLNWAFKFAGSVDWLDTTLVKAYKERLIKKQTSVVLLVKFSCYQAKFYQL